MKTIIADIISVGRCTIKASVDSTIQEIVNEVDKYVPEGAWGEVKDILTFLVGNGLDFATGSFVTGLKKKNLNNFYIDTRVKTKPVSSGWSMGKVGKKGFLKALKSLKQSM